MDLADGVEAERMRMTQQGETDYAVLALLGIIIGMLAAINGC